MLDIKVAVQVRLLHCKMPVPATQVLRDLVSRDGETAVVAELVFMVIGGGGGSCAAPAPGVVVAEGACRNGRVRHGGVNLRWFL